MDLDKTRLQDMLQTAYHLFENIGSMLNSTGELMESNREIHETNKKNIEEINSGLAIIEDANQKLVDIISSASDKILENPVYVKSSLAIAGNIVNVLQDIVNKLKVNAESAQRFTSIGVNACQFADNYKSFDSQIAQVSTSILDVMKDLNEV